MRDAIEYKAFRLDLKDVSDEGRFTGYVSAFGNEDHDGDIVDPGAFLKTVAERKGIFPMLWQHDSHQPIGVSERMSEDAYGLETDGAFNLDTQRGKEAFSLLRQGALQGFSIGYVPIKSGKGARGARHLKEIKLYEFSVVTFPANPLAVPTGLKALEILRNARELEAELRGGTLTDEHRAELASAVKSLSALLDSEPEPSTQDDEAATKTDEPEILSTLLDWHARNFDPERGN